MTIDDFPSELFHRWIEDQVALGPRRPGSDADRASERMLEGLLREFGLDSVRAEPIPITRWGGKPVVRIM